MTEEYKFLIELILLGVALGTLVYKLGKIHAGVELLVDRLDRHVAKSDGEVKDLRTDVENLSVDVAVLRARHG